ncbi:MAG: MFS transporter [Eggerthellaceae bacterium]|nr:MFS transporter [Eggerthellaceae bacterium]
MAKKGSGFKWAVLFLMVFGAAMLNFSNMVFSARSVDVMAQFGMDQAQLTAISGIGVLPGALFSVVLGNFFDKRGPSSIRYAGAVLLFLAAACQIWRVFAGTYVELFIITFLSGTFFLPTQVLPAKMIEAWFERSEMGTAMGVYGAAAGIGITAAFAVGALFPTTTMALAFCAGGYVVVAVYWLLAAKLPSSEAPSEAASDSGDGPKVSVGAVLKSKNMWLIMICGGLAAGAPLLYNSYIINAFIDKGMEPALTSLVGVLFNIGLVVGAIVTGFIVSKAGRYNRVYTTFPIIAATCLVASYFIPLGPQTFVLTVAGALFAASTLSVNMARIGLIPLTGDFGPENIGIAGGMNNTAMGVCMFVLPTISAVALGNNYVGVFITLFVFFAIMALCGGILLPELGENGELARRARGE